MLNGDTVCDREDLSLYESVTIGNTCACYDEYRDHGSTADFYDATGGSIGFYQFTWCWRIHRSNSGVVADMGSRGQVVPFACLPTPCWRTRDRPRRRGSSSRVPVRILLLIPRCLSSSDIPLLRQPE